MTTTTDAFEDVIDSIVGVRPGDRLDALRHRRPVTREQLQASHDALFTPIDDSQFVLVDRLLVAAFATRLTAADATAEHYADRAFEADAARTGAVQAAAVEQSAAGPYGRYAEAGLQSENAEGLRFEPDERLRDAVGERLAAALAHAHLLTYRPREASSDALERLLAAGWSIDGIVTLSQLVSFLAFQQRVASGLRALTDESAQKETAA